jgi:hypothetical protein
MCLNLSKLCLNLSKLCLNSSKLCLNFAEESMIWRARNFRDKDLEERAKSLKTPSCEHLQKISQNYVIW